MAKDIWIISDTHFSHARSLEFVNEHTGEKMRPWLPGQVDEMNETMIENWNRVVKPDSTIWHLGDVWFTKDGWKILDRLNGTKELVLGNHDHKDMTILTTYFKRLHGSITVRSKSGREDLILTHIPIHTSQFGRFFGNVHGHIHKHSVTLPNGDVDPRYFNACVEMNNYTPVHLDDVLQQIRKARQDKGFIDLPTGR